VQVRAEIPFHSLDAKLKGNGMPRIFLVSLAALATCLLTACPAFFINRGGLVAPTNNNVRPAVTSLPNASSYVELQDRWRREASVGAAGSVIGTLKDPGLVAAEVSHRAAVEGLNQAATDDLLISTWSNAFGPDLDRWSIDLDWRFDEQFVTHPEVLDPSTWTFVLHVDERVEYAPLGVSTLSHGQVPVQHYWEGRIRLWFPWRDHTRDLTLLSGITREIRLEMRHPSGTGDLTWRFRTAF
jgi:hypothetical protein